MLPIKQVSPNRIHSSPRCRGTRWNGHREAPCGQTFQLTFGQLNADPTLRQHPLCEYCRHMRDSKKPLSSNPFQTALALGMTKPTLRKPEIQSK